MKNKVLAILGGTVALFGLGYLIYAVLPFNFVTVENPNFPVIILMNVLYATFVTIIFSRWAQIKTFATGAQAGLIIGAFIGCCSALWLLGISDLVDFKSVISATITVGIRFAVAGGVIGWFLGRD